MSDKTLYDLFARTVPSDMFQARAIADIVLKLNWSYVSLVSSEGLYGDSGSKEFMKQASVRRICIATHEKVSPATDGNAYDIIVASLLKRNATGVVLFTRAEDTKELLRAVKRAGLLHNFAWVAADGWGTHQKLVEGVEEVAWGAITVELQAKAIPGFDQYMKALTPWANLRNPWFSEYWQEWFDCQLQASLLQQQQVAAGFYSARRAGPARAAADDGGPLGGPAESQDYALDDNESGRMRRRSLSGGLERAGCPLGSVNGSGQALAAAERPSCARPGAATAASSTSSPAGPSAASVQPTGRPRAEPSRATARRRRAASGQPADINSEFKAKQFCSPNLRISESNSYRQEQKVQFVVDAVYAMAHALHKAWYQLCDAKPGVVCEALKELNGK